MDYFLQLEGLWEEINFHRPLQMCTCYHKFCYVAIQNAQVYRLEDQAIQFLT